MSAAQLVWTTWHHVPFDNAAMTNAVVALHRANPDAEIAALRAANAELLAALRAFTFTMMPKEKLPYEAPVTIIVMAGHLRDVRAVIAKAGGAK